MEFLWHLNKAGVQDIAITSYVGGLPRLPPSTPLPLDALDGAKMTFFFSLDLSGYSGFDGWAISVFAATTSYDENDCIPELLFDGTPGYEVPNGALSACQRHFRILVTKLEGAVLRNDYEPKILFFELCSGPAMPEMAVKFGERGQQPRWLLDDESPGTYGGSDRFSFLFQTEEGYCYETYSDAPRQMVPDYTVPTVGALTESLVKTYDLWVRNAAYFFITPKRDVLVVAQSG